MNTTRLVSLIVGFMAMTTVTGCASQRTFRVACLEYSGHTGLTDSDEKMEVLYRGLDTALTSQAVAGTPLDMIVTGEFPTLMGSEDGMANMAQPIPGPRTDQFATIAAKHSVWIVADLLESDPSENPPKSYNTAIVFDRGGRIVDTYRKVRLPPDEQNRLKISPGNGVVSVDTEFGRVVPIICWEAQFPDYVEHVMTTVRQKHGRPHLIVHPTAGDFGEQLPGIARQYRVFIASTAWSGPSRVIAPDGTVLDQQQYDGGDPAEMKLAVADIPCGRD